MKTLIKVGSEYIWIWVVIEPINRHIFAVTASKERTMLVAERFFLDLVKIHGKHPVSMNGGT